MDRDDEPLMIISSDGHVGQPVEAYRDYIDPQHRAEYEGWLGPQDNIRDVMRGVPESEVRAMLAQNAARAYGLDLERLRPVADRVGPQVGQLVSA